MVDHIYNYFDFLLFDDYVCFPFFINLFCDSSVVTKAHIFYHYAQVLTKVMEIEKGAQMCMYNVSRKTNFSFYGVPDFLSVQPDDNLRLKVWIILKVVTWKIV